MYDIYRNDTFLESDLESALMTLGQNYDTASGHEQYFFCKLGTSNVPEKKGIDQTRIMHFYFMLP